MDRKVIEQTVQQVKKNSPKRNFKQSVDLVVNLKDINLKNPDEQVNMFATFEHDIGKNISICALVGPELEDKSKAACNETVLLSDFDKFKNKKDMKKLADRHDFFIAQATIMPKIATAFGRVFGPRGKMPNPKVGAVVPPNANLDPLVAKLKKTVQLATKNDMTVRCMVGKEDNDDKVLVDNIMNAYNSIIQKLPNDENNVRNVMIKFTMGPSFMVGGKPEEKESAKEGKPAEKQEAPEDKKEEKKAEAKETSKEQPKEESQSKESEEKSEETAQ